MKTEEILKLTDEVQFKINQELYLLKFWFDSLYTYNGKSTSKVKQISSRLNGKKGGRPPKHITEAKKRINEIEKNIKPELEHSISISEDKIDKESLNTKLHLIEQELNDLYKLVSDYKTNKNQKE